MFKKGVSRRLEESPQSESGISEFETSKFRVSKFGVACPKNKKQNKKQNRKTRKQKQMPGKQNAKSLGHAARASPIPSGVGEWSAETAVL